MSPTFTSTLRRIWLPLFLVLSLSWLFAPGYNRDHFGTIQLISSYEANTLRYSDVFRICDVGAGLLLVAAPWLFGIILKSRGLGYLLVAIGGLSAMDGLFPGYCQTAQQLCSDFQLHSRIVHDTESVLVAVIIIVAALVHAHLYKRWESLAFVVAQAVIGLLIISGLLSMQAIVVSQYVYEVMVISWLAWLVSSYGSVFTLSTRFVRHGFALWALLNGALAIVASITHLHIYRPILDVVPFQSSALIAQHGIVAGVLMLYIARHVYQGQHRAMLLLLVLFGTQLIKYSVLTPEPIMLALNIVSFALLLYARQSFDRNSGPLLISQRFKDAGIVVAGVCVAVALSYGLSTVAGHRQAFEHGVHTLYDKPATLAHDHTRHLSERMERRFQLVADTLIVSTAVLTLWSLFRPARFVGRYNPHDVQKARALLEHYSNSSEDYFKIWPSDKTYFFSSAVEGFVAYTVVSSIAFALADPICQATDRRQLLSEFVNFTRSNGWTACFLLVQADSSAVYEQDLKIMKVGSSAVVNVQAFCTSTLNGKWWRWQRNRATKTGLKYEMLRPPYGDGLMRELRAVSDAWLSTANHTEQGFALGYFDQGYLQQCRLHIVRDETGKLVAFANELPTFGGRQATVDLIRYMPDYDGSMPHLLSCLISSLNEAGSADSFDLGFVPLAGLDSNIATIARRLSDARFSSSGLKQFKNKFGPDWQPNYIAYDGDLVDVARIATTLEAALKKR